MKLLKSPDEPLGGIKMIPRDTITIIVGKCVVIVVIPFSESEKCEDEIIDRCELSGISLGAPGMSERIDEKHRMMEDKHPCQKSEIKARKPVRQHSYRKDDNEVEIESNKTIIFMLESDPFTRPEIGNFCRIHRWSFEEEPSHMGIKKSLLDIIWIFFGVSFSMMDSVIVGPGRSRASKSETSEQEIEYFYRSMCLIGPV
jgi:hypothetical protein